MRTITTYRFAVKPAFDMFIVEGDAVITASSMDLEKLLNGFWVDHSDLDQISWVPMDLRDEDYDALRKLGIEAPDLVPVFSGERLEEAYRFTARRDVDSETVLEFDFGRLSVYSADLQEWWAKTRREKGYGC